MMAMRFEVRYGTLLVVTTALAIVALLGIVLVGAFKGPLHLLPQLLMCVIPVMLIVGTVLFAVLRYEIDDAGLHVVRPIGRLRIFSRVSMVAAADGALKGAMRTFGNGGLFSFNGWYWVRGYGSSRLWVTDFHSLVAMRGDRGSVFVSPAKRDEFIAAVRTRFGITP